MSDFKLVFPQRPEGSDVAVTEDGIGMYVALTASHYDDIMNSLVTVREERANAVWDMEEFKKSWENASILLTESAGDVERLDAEVQRLTEEKDFWVRTAQDRCHQIGNLEAQRDVLIRAIGDLGSMVKP